MRITGVSSLSSFLRCRHGLAQLLSGGLLDTVSLCVYLAPHTLSLFFSFSLSSYPPLSPLPSLFRSVDGNSVL